MLGPSDLFLGSGSWGLEYQNLPKKLSLNLPPQVGGYINILIDERVETRD